MIRDALLAAGIADDTISVIPDEQRAIDHVLQMAEPGDLVLIFADALARSWKQVVHFRPAGSVEAPATNGDRATATVVAEDEGLADAPPDDEALRSASRPLIEELAVVRDERGVHLARESDD
jgi:cyanophycin synthetase